MFLLISSVAHETASVNEEMGKPPKNGEMNRNIAHEKEEARQMKIESQSLLLEIARNAIIYYLEDRIPSKLQGLDAELLQQSGAFVTLHKRGQLRGCVGQIVSDKPLYETAAEAAIAAATRDPRFHRVNLSEMPEVEIEISVLTPLQPLERTKDLEIGVHGLYIKDGVHSGLLRRKLREPTTGIAPNSSSRLVKKRSWRRRHGKTQKQRYICLVRRSLERNSNLQK